MGYDDTGHRPHAVHTGEYPENHPDMGPYGLRVTLDTWGPQDFVHTMADYLQSNWGDAPSHLDRHDSGDSAKAYTWAEACFKRKTLQQVLEGLSFWFTIDGVCRAATHQIVRTRIGAAFMQHGGRDNDWRHRGFSVPETVRRIVRVIDNLMLRIRRGTDWRIPHDPGNLESPLLPGGEEILKRLLVEYDYPTLADAVEDTLQRCKNLYAALVDAGVPWQDARRFLPMGTQTYIHAIYNYVALRDVLANRLEHIMDWEINCVAQLMLRELRMKCPPVIWQHLGSHSDMAQSAKFEHLESWPPDGKWPALQTERCECGHSRGNHSPCGVPHETCCEVRGCQCIQYCPVDSIRRTHRREQMPFWVLHPDSMAGGPIVWVPTNGTYPRF